MFQNEIHRGIKHCIISIKVREEIHYQDFQTRLNNRVSVDNGITRSLDVDTRLSRLPQPKSKQKEN